MEEIIGIAEAKNELSELVNRAAYGGERIVLGSRGKPKAAIVSLADLRKLQMIELRSSPTASIADMRVVHVFGENPAQRDARAVLAEAADLRRAMSEARGGRPLPDSSDDIRQIRDERASR